MFPKFQGHFQSDPGISKIGVKFLTPFLTNYNIFGLLEQLDDFFPRYVEALERAKYQINGKWIPAKKNISQIRIEGHASHEWTQRTPEKIRFLKNMDLSQRDQTLCQAALVQMDKERMAFESNQYKTCRI